jgi:hypothetical protein
MYPLKPLSRRPLMYCKKVNSANPEWAIHIYMMILALLSITVVGCGNYGKNMKCVFETPEKDFQIFLGESQKQYDHPVEIPVSKLAEALDDYQNKHLYCENIGKHINEIHDALFEATSNQYVTVKVCNNRGASTLVGLVNARRGTYDTRNTWMELWYKDGILHIDTPATLKTPEEYRIKTD